MVWLYKFWGGINDWDLKILYKDLENKKKWLKKVEWNGMIWRIEKSEKIEWVEWLGQTWGIFLWLK